VKYAYNSDITGTLTQQFICLKSVVKLLMWFGHQLGGALTTNQLF